MYSTIPKPRAEEGAGRRPTIHLNVRSTNEPEVNFTLFTGMENCTLSTVDGISSRLSNETSFETVSALRSTAKHLKLENLL